MRVTDALLYWLTTKHATSFAKLAVIDPDLGVATIQVKTISFPYDASVIGSKLNAPKGDVRIV